MGNFNNRFFEKRIRWQLVSLLNWINYPDMRKSFKFGKILHSNRYLLLIIKLVIILTISSFMIARIMDKHKVNELKSELVSKEDVIDSLLISASSKDSTISNITRTYFEYKVVKESSIKDPTNLKQIPDSILFLMISEADRYKIPYFIFFRIMEKESQFKFVKNTEGSTAMGYMQIIKSTFKRYSSYIGINDDEDTPGNNIRVAAYMIASRYKFWSTKFKSERTIWEYTIAEYRVGIANMIKDGKFFIPDAAKYRVNYVLGDNFK